MKYIEKHTVSSQYTDCNGILKAGALLRYMQEAACNSMEADGRSYEDLASDGLIFVLSKITLSIYSDIRANDDIEVETWACEGQRYSHLRCYRVTRGGMCMAEASSVWALVNKATHRLVRVTDAALPFRTDDLLDLEVLQKIPLPVDMSLVGERNVCYSDIDRNMHMNNTVYADMICDYAFAKSPAKVSRISISYLNEAPFGEVLKVYRSAMDDTVYIKTVRTDNKTNIEAEIICENM